MSTRLRYGIYERRLTDEQLDAGNKRWKVQLPDIHTAKPVYLGAFATLDEAIVVRDAARDDPREWVKKRNEQRTSSLSPRQLARLNTPALRATHATSANRASFRAAIPEPLIPYLQPIRNVYRLSLPFGGRMRIVGDYPTIEDAVIGAEHGFAMLAALAGQRARADLAQRSNDPEIARRLNDPEFDNWTPDVTPEPALQTAQKAFERVASSLSISPPKP